MIFLGIAIPAAAFGWACLERDLLRKTHVHFSGSWLKPRHDLFGKPASTFPDHGLNPRMTFSENRRPLFRIMA
jgi:hypothetical protein